MMHLDFMYVVVNFLFAKWLALVMRIENTVVQPQAKRVFHVVATLFIQISQRMSDADEHEVVPKSSLLSNTCSKNGKSVVAMFGNVSPLSLSGPRIEIICVLVFDRVFVYDFNAFSN